MSSSGKVSLGELVSAQARVAAVRDRGPRGAHVHLGEQDEAGDDAKLVDHDEIEPAEPLAVPVDEVVALVEGRERQSQEHEVVHEVAHVHAKGCTRSAAKAQQVLRRTPEPEDLVRAG